MRNPQKQVDGKTIIKDVVQAVMGGKALKKATAPLGEDSRQSLSRAIKMDVDEWRAEFADKLRSAANDLLELTVSELREIEPNNRAYALSVFCDKLIALDGRSSLASASVNIQVNNFGNASKASLLDQLGGTAISLPAQPSDARPAQSVETPLTVS